MEESEESGLVQPGAARKYKRGTITTWSRVNFWLALISILLMAAVVIISFIYPSLVSNYRAGLLTMHGILAMQILSAGLDQEFLDFVLALVASFFAIVADFAAMIFSWISVTSCSTDIDYFICTNEPSLRYVMPVISTVLSVFVVVHFISLIYWFIIERKLLGDKAPKLELAIVVAGGRTFLTLLQIFSVIGCFSLIALTGINIAFIYEVSFYRAVFLIIPAHLYGTQLAFFGSIPRSWRTAVLVFSLASLISTVYGAILEFPRFFRCILSSSAPSGQIETVICNEESWRGYMVPLMLLLAIIFSVVTFVAVLVAMTRASSPPKEQQD